jgi:hypothetical protein
MRGPVVVLGPQRPEPNLGAVLRELDVRGPLVAITAGWRHDELEIDNLRNHVGDVDVLPLYGWYELLRAHAPSVLDAYSRRQDRIKQYKDLYRVRMRAAMAVVRELSGHEEAPPELLAPEVDRAIEAVRRIDEDALASIDRIRTEFPEVRQRFEHPAVVRGRDEAARRIARAGAVLIAGGHVAVLRNRLMFFGAEHALEEALQRGVPVIGWGAGSMLLTDRIVLFYDDPPEGPTEPEILDRGLGFVKDVVLFPHARRRLRLDRADRIGALAKRFGPCCCIGLENGARVIQAGDRWVNLGVPGAAMSLGADGVVSPLEGEDR